MAQEQPGAAARQPRRSSAARLFGYDMFISFALGAPPRGSQSYASDLARRLRERDFTVFFSEDEAPPGEPLTPTLRTALHKARMLVVVVFAASGPPRFQLDHGAPVLASAIGADGRRVATVTEGRGVQVFTLDPAELIAQACARQPQPLTAAEWRQYLGANPPATDACGRPPPAEDAP